MQYRSEITITCFTAARHHPGWEDNRRSFEQNSLPVAVHVHLAGKRVGTRAVIRSSHCQQFAVRGEGGAELVVLGRIDSQQLGGKLPGGRPGCLIRRKREYLDASAREKARRERASKQMVQG